MKVIDTKLPEVKILEPQLFEDERGWFFEEFRDSRFAELGLPTVFRQENRSRSGKNVLRGLHYQLQHPQGKLVTCTKGAILDVAVDIRRGSPTFGDWVGVELTAERPRMLWIPEGFAHGFCVVGDGADVAYKCTDVYVREDDRGILWNDPAIGIEWPLRFAAGVRPRSFLPHAARVRAAPARVSLPPRVKVLLVGAAGMLGRDIVRACPPNAHCEPLDRRQLDVRDVSAVARAIRERRPDWLFNCSGITNVEDAERDPELAYAVNATAVGAMARACAGVGARMLHFSTDYVFDGSKQGSYVEDDETGPVNEYGRSKLAGEMELTQSGAEHLLIRTQWLFGVHGRSFAGLMCDRAQARERTRVVSDEYGCCTYTRDLASVTWELVAVARGTVHVANRGRVSRFDIARRVFEEFGVPGLLTECSSEEFGSIAQRPANSALSVARAEGLLGRPMRSWEEALADFLREREENHKTRGTGTTKNA